MVVPSLAIGGVVCVLLSGGFIWYEVGRFAAPQVPVTVFDERKLIVAYTVGLFVGVPLGVVYLLLGVSLANGALFGAVVFLLALVGGGELVQYLALRTAYWRSPAAPFYALALRAGVGGILALVVISTYLGGASLSAVGAAEAGLVAVAVVALETTGALVTLSVGGRGRSKGPRPLSGILFGAFGFFLVSVGPLTGPEGGLGAGAVALAGAVLVYRRLRTTLDDVPAPGTANVPTGSGPLPGYARTDAPVRGRSGPPGPPP